MQTYTAKGEFANLTTGMIKIILNEKKIILTKRLDTLWHTLVVENAHICFTLTPSKAVDLVDFLLISEFQHVIVVGDEQAHLAIFKSAFPVIRAGGGLVQNDKNEYLFIYRRKKWDLPKGKLDPGEEIEACALREVHEETGIQNLELGPHLLDTYHLYIEDIMVLKETTWFMMYSNDAKLAPQKEEGIQKALWVHRNNIHLQLNKTYESVIDLFEKLHA